MNKLYKAIIWLIAW